MYSTLDKLTQDSMKGYIDSEEETEKILDNVVKYNMRELNPKWKDETGNDTFLTLIKMYYSYETSEDMTEDNLLGYMNLADRTMEKPMKILPWPKLLSAVTLDTLFAVYSKRSTQGINHNKNLKKLKGLIKKCTDLQVNETTTVGEVLEEVRNARKRAWRPNEDLKSYASTIRGCYRIIKAILYDGPADIYDVKNLCEDTLDEAEDTDRSDNSKEIV